MHTRPNFIARMMALALILLVGPLALIGAEEPRLGPPPGASISIDEYGAFIQEEFGVSFKASVSKDDFLAALSQALDTPVDKLEAASLADPAFTSLAAVSTALKAADMAELAYSYPPAKADAAIARAKINAAGLDAKSKQELAAAIDTGLLAPALLKGFSVKAAVSSDLAEGLLGGVLDARGLYKHYIGEVLDSDIYTKLIDAFNRSSIIKAPELRAVVDAALKQSLVTGYNLKDSRFDPHFIDALTITYGHSDLKHAVQLLGLLRSEGINAKVQLEPKTSAFVYLKEWGDPGASNEFYEVVQIENGNFIEYAKEYDIAFEFANAGDKADFEAIILAYAKKNEKNQPGLIYGSWWQPLYFSMTSVKDYTVITNNKITTTGPYYAQSFSLNEEADKVSGGFKKLAPSMKVESYQFWVDAPFYRYLKGESK